MRAWMLGAALLALPSGAARAAEQLTDAAIERRKQELDEAWRAVERETQREFADSVAFAARLKDERLDFERRQIVQRKRMLDSLRGLDASRRKAVYEDFHAQETRERADFAKRLKEEKAAYHRAFLEEREGAQRALKRRREALVEGHRGG